MTRSLSSDHPQWPRPHPRMFPYSPRLLCRTSQGSQTPELALRWSGPWSKWGGDWECVGGSPRQVLGRSTPCLRECSCGGGPPTAMAAMQSSGVSSMVQAKAPPLTALHWSHLALSSWPTAHHCTFWESSTPGVGGEQPGTQRKLQVAAGWLPKGPPLTTAKP